MPNDSGTGRTSSDFIVRELLQVKADIRRLDRHQHPDQGAKRSSYSGLVAGRWDGALQTISHGGSAKKMVLTISDYEVNVGAITYTSSASGTQLDGWAPGLYTATAMCKWWYTSPSGGLRPSLELGGGAVPWISQYVTLPLPVAGSEVFGGAVTLTVTDNLDAGDDGFYVAISNYASSASDTWNASCTLTVVRHAGYPGS